MVQSSSPSMLPPARPLLYPALAWLPILGLIALSGLCLLAQQGAILNLLFPAGAFAVAVILYCRYPVIYVGFVWWLWFLTPFIRRLSDYFGNGWTDPSPLLLAPLMATLVCGWSMVRGLRRPAIALPFLLCGVSVLYGLGVGLIWNEPQAAILSGIGWLAPVCLGYFLVDRWRSFPLYRRLLQRTFTWGVLGMGTYGLVQYLVAPAWDRAWMRDALEFGGLNSIGFPEPFGIRVFSTSNAPQTFAVVMVAGILLQLASAGRFKLLSTGVGTIAFLLSLARSAWIGLALGLACLVPSLKSGLQIRLVASLLVLLLALVPAVQFEPFSSAILPRLQGLTDTSDDVSARDRSEGYQRLLGKAFSDIPGQGLGFTFEDETIGDRDSGLLTLWFSLGWVGALPYITGLGLLIVKLFHTRVNHIDPFFAAARASAIATLSQLGLNDITSGVMAVVLWTFLGIGIAAVFYYAALPQQRSEGLVVKRLGHIPAGQAPPEPSALGSGVARDVSQWNARSG